MHLRTAVLVAVVKVPSVVGHSDTRLEGYPYSKAKGAQTELDRHIEHSLAMDTDTDSPEVVPPDKEAVAQAADGFRTLMVVKEESHCSV